MKFLSGILTSFAAAASMVIGASAVQAQQANWSGLNIGIHGGYVQTHNSGFFDNLGADHQWDSNDLNGGVFGVQLGYSIQSGPLVFGLELDASGVLGSESVVDSEGDTQRVDMDYLASARLSLGYAFSNALLYVTGGVGFTEADAIYENGAGTESVSATGYVLGGGLKLAFSETVSLGIEYLHYEFDESSLIPPNQLVTDADAGDNYGISNADVVRIALNFRLGRSSAPVIEESFK